MKETETERRPGRYYVARQAERVWGVYYTNALGNSRQESLHRTRRAAVQRRAFLNEGWRLEQQERERAK